MPGGVHLNAQEELSAFIFIFIGSAIGAAHLSVLAYQKGSTHPLINPSTVMSLLSGSTMFYFAPIFQAVIRKFPLLSAQEKRLFLINTLLGLLIGAFFLQGGSSLSTANPSPTDNTPEDNSISAFRPTMR